ncbi:cytochrome P450 [Xylariomycetidae sp. FL0641]|nr:cytochrome P450 [Xylariomycetidae sp. FL0641]
MVSNTILVAFGCLIATYAFLRFLLHLTQDAREPPPILTGLPFFGPIIRMAREKSHLYPRLRDQYRLPIYTLRLPFSRMYIVNATELIPSLQKQWRTVSFAAIAADAGYLVGLSKEGNDILHRDLTSEKGFSPSWPKYIARVMSPGEDLDAINRKSVEIYAAEMEQFRRRAAEGSGHAKVGLSQWSRQIMVVSTTEAIWGPQNPYRDPAVAESWRVFESGFLTLNVFPFASLFFPKLYRAREHTATAMISYMRNGGYKTASGLVRKRIEHHRQFGLSMDDIARGELGNTFAVLGNSTPCAFWVLYHIFSDDRVLADVRSEVSALVRESDSEDGTGTVCSIDLTNILDSCKILFSTFKEVLRYRAVNPGPRVLLEDVHVEGILLKKGSMLMIPATVQHTDVSAWGQDAKEFNHLRFVPKPGQKKENRVAFRAFGGGHVLCPGRHFATTEIMALSALLALQFDISPVAGHWVEPSWENSPVQAGFPVPDEDLPIELKPRDPEKKWQVTYSGSGKAMGIVMEDTVPGDE